MNPRYFILVCLIGLMGPACARQHLYTEQEVREFVVPGTPLEKIIQRFGEPMISEKNPKFEDGSTEIDEIVYFELPLPPPWGARGFRILRFSGQAEERESSELVFHQSKCRRKMKTRPNQTPHPTPL